MQERGETCSRCAILSTSCHEGKVRDPMIRLSDACRVISWSVAAVAGAAASGADAGSPIPNQVIQMIQPGSTVMVSRVVSSSTTGKTSTFKSVSFNNDIDSGKKESLVKLLKNSANFSGSTPKGVEVWYFIYVKAADSFVNLDIEKEGLTISDKKVIVRTGLSEAGLQRFLDWAADASKPPVSSRIDRNPAPFSEPSVQLHPSDNLMKILTGGDGTK
jgi:hypothetical protein